MFECHDDLPQNMIPIENPNTLDEHGYTPLMRAIIGDEVIKTTLLEDGLSKITPVTDGQKLTRIEKTLELLQNPKTNLNLQSYNGKTALMIAAEIGRDDLVEALLKDGRIIPGIKDNNKHNALFYALEGLTFAKNHSLESSIILNFEKCIKIMSNYLDKIDI